MEALKNTLAENWTGTHNLVSKGHQFDLSSVPDLKGKVAVVTGGSEGIGYGCTHTLLTHNISKLFILSMSKAVVDGATDAIRSELGDAAAQKVRWLQCDLSDWKATAETAWKISKETDRLDILINNAGRGIMTRQLASSNGMDLHMATNHFGHVVLTSHLLPLLKKTADQGSKVRIVNAGSNAHQNAPKEVKFESVEELNKNYGPNEQYGRSKLAAILYSRYLARHLKISHPNILVNVYHPGVVETRQSSEHILEPYPLAGYAMKIGLAPFKKGQFEGAVSAMFAATVTEKSGQYICPPAIPEDGSEQSQNKELGEALMKLTGDVVQSKTAELSSAKGCPFRDH
ncbi:retinol dehydrogenase 12 [Patellaria atrata CBS 101060]|uniref:Retinol dehydrogenase 12 n=1 Tax=Patellaria atrata CBS 101060 TaxID=1346257 RepID=A0A9P4VQW7_9PEZI|nr:retinol dehydrogenase 12 [Patellaria atrata CBS 101060]